MDEFDLFRSWLDDCGADGKRLRLWLRDDDAVAQTAALDRLLSGMNRCHVPGLLAVIPSGFTRELAQRIADEPLVWAAPHGWAHQNHQPPESKKSEFGDNRSRDAIAADLERGNRAISAAFSDSALPIFVPPWNRIGVDALDALPDAEYQAVSVFGAEKSGRLPQINTHVDLIDWRGNRGGKPADVLLAEVRTWADASPPAIGLLTHHLVHDDAAWDFLDRFMAVTGKHPAVDWMSPKALLSEALAQGAGLE